MSGRGERERRGSRRKEGGRKGGREKRRDRGKPKVLRGNEVGSNPVRLKRKRDESERERKEEERRERKERGKARSVPRESGGERRTG